MNLFRLFAGFPYHPRDVKISCPLNLELIAVSRTVPMTFYRRWLLTGFPLKT